MGSFIDIEVLHGATDISDKVISYQRNLEICTGIGTLELILNDDGYAIDLWDQIKITELGHQKGIFFVSGNEKGVRTGTRRITAQDGSKYLSDYFISDSYTIDYESYTGYWIEKFLDEAKVSHGAIGTGVALSDNTQLGLSSAYDTIQTLLQYSGWYLYFNSTNTAQVGSMSVKSGNPTKLTDSSIRAVTVNKNDSMLRNRAVVSGNYDVTASSYIFADNSINTPWNYDSKDKRAILISNSAIYSQSDADELSRKLLTEFAKLNCEKTVEIVGEVNVTVGDFVNIKSKGWSGTGLVTTIDVNLSSSGLVTTLILDQRCPRLFAYWGELVDYVYVGTDGAGVWRKPISDTGWESHNTGIPSGEYSITDLYINNQVFGTIAGSGDLYYKQFDDPWNLYVPSGIQDENGTTVSGLLAKGLTINHQTNNLIVGYNNTIPSGEGMRAWVLEITPSGELVRDDIVYIASGDYDTHIVDLDTNDVDNIISTYTPTVEIIPSGIDGYNFGCRTDLPNSLQTGSITTLPIPASGLISQNHIDYVSGGCYTYEWIEHTSTSPSSVITQAEGLNSTYAYFLYPKRVSAYAYKSIARRVKLVNTLGVLTTVVTDVDTNLQLSGSIYKVPDNNDFLYIATTSKIYLVNFATGTCTLMASYTLPSQTNIKNATYWENNKYLYVEQFGKYMYVLYRKIYGNPTLDNYNIEYNCTKVDMTNGNVYSYIVDSIVMAGLNITRHINITGSYHVKIEDERMLIMEWIFTGTLAVPVWSMTLIYGTDNESTSQHMYTTNYWTQDPDDIHTSYVGESYDGIAHQRAVSGFVGNTIDLTNISTSTFCYILDTSIMPGWPGYVVKTFSSYSHLDDTLVPYVEIQNIEYSLCDYPPMGYTDERLACSSSISSTPYFLSSSGTHYCIRSGITGETIKELDPDDYDCTTLYITWNTTYNSSGGIGGSYSGATNTRDDIDDSIYILGKKKTSGYFRILAINISGDLVKEMDFGPYPYYGYYYAYSIRSFVSNNFMVTTLLQQDRNGHWSYINTIMYCYPLNPNYITTGTGYQILRQQEDVFTPILTVDALYQVEISKPSPIEVFNITSSSIMDIYQAETASGLFSTVTPAYETYDGRVFDIQSPSTFVTTSGVVGSGLRYFGIASDDGLKAFPTNLTDESLTILPSGCYHLEMTNNTVNPYIFVSTSGDSPIFWEREPTASGFVNYSVGIPSGVDLTCIRVDDKL